MKLPDALLSTAHSAGSVVSLAVILKLVAHVTCALSLSCLLPFVVRWLILPASIEHRVPLNFVITTCKPELRGACSFPYATHNYEPESLFTEGVTYGLTLQLDFVDSDALNRVDFFQVGILFYNSKGEILREHLKIVYPRVRSLVSKTWRFFFFPLYFIGIFQDSTSISALITSAHMELLNLSSKLDVVIENRLVMLSSAELLIQANFGWIRYVLTSWPLISYMVLFFVSLAFYAEVMFLLFGFKFAWSWWNDDTPPESSCDIPQSTASASPIKKPVRATPKRADDEYIPDNVNEVPQCVELDVGPMNSSTPESNVLRERKNLKYIN